MHLLLLRRRSQAEADSDGLRHLLGDWKVDQRRDKVVVIVVLGFSIFSIAAALLRSLQKEWLHDMFGLGRGSCAPGSGDLQQLHQLLDVLCSGLGLAHTLARTCQASLGGAGGAGKTQLALCRRVGLLNVLEASSPLAELFFAFGALEALLFLLLLLLLLLLGVGSGGVGERRGGVVSI